MSRIVTRSLSASAIALLTGAGLAAGAAPASAAAYCGYSEVGFVYPVGSAIQCTADISTSSPTISGAAIEGLTLRATQGKTWKPIQLIGKGMPVLPLQLEVYQWQRNGVKIDGATSSTYRLTSADVGARISVTMLTLVAGPGMQWSWTSAATSAVSAGSTAYAAPAVSPFGDVSTGQQFYKEMAWLSDRNISTGWTEGDGSRTYRPLTSINRDAMAAFLYRLAGSPDYAAPAISPFRDVSTGQQFYKEMAWLSDQNISAGWTEGDGSRSYRPLTSINRDAMAAFLYRLAGSPDYTAPAVSPFRDVSTSQQFYKEMAWLSDQNISAGWTEGDGSRTYRPLTSINRDAMAAFLYRLAGKTA